MNNPDEYKAYLRNVIASPDKVIKKENTLIIIINEKTPQGLSGLRFAIWKKGNTEKLYLRGTPYTGTGRTVTTKWGNQYEDDVRRIRDEIDRNGNSLFEIDDDGEVRSIVSFSTSVPPEKSALLKVYQNARQEILRLYDITQKKLSKLRVMNPPRDIDYQNADLKAFNYDSSLFKLYETKYGRITTSIPPKNGGQVSRRRLSKDGFYPYYFDQKPRILVLGRTPLKLEGENYIENTLGNMQQGKFGNTDSKIMKTIGQLFFPKEKPENLFHLFARKPGFSYAFINVCPLNPKNRKRTDWNEYKSVFDATKQQLKNRIENLVPDCIVALGVDHKDNPKTEVIKDLFGVDRKSPQAEVETLYVTIKGISIPLLYSKYHPSGSKWGKSEPFLCSELSTLFP